MIRRRGETGSITEAREAAEGPEPPRPTYQPPAPAQPAPRGATPDHTVTVIGNGARLEGTLVSAASLRIEGTVKGKIEAEGDVVVAPESQVAADIRATNVTIGGRYTGNVNASGSLELSSTARVQGNLTCTSLIVNQGAIFSGQSIMEGLGAAPGEQKKAERKIALPEPEAKAEAGRE